MLDPLIQRWIARYRTSLDEAREYNRVLGVPITQLVALAIIADGNDRPLLLAEALGLEGGAAAASDLVGRITAAGYVTRNHATEGDLRVVRLVLTLEGTRVLAEWLPRLRDLMREREEAHS